MTTVIRQTKGHYEVEKVPYGRDFNWCSDCVVVQCDCGERLELTALETTCGCGADHASLDREPSSFQEGLGEDLVLKEEHRRWKAEQDDYLRSEDNYRRELKTLE